MSKQTQKEAVFTAVSNVLAEAGITITENTNVAPQMTKERRAQVNQILFEGFKSGSIELERSFEDSDLKGYVSGLVSNWLRKDKRLNGGMNYVAKNPGSRAGSGDAQVREMKKLLSTLEADSADYIEVQGYIDSRVKEIAATKTKSVKIDYSALPADLQSKFSK